MCGQAQHFLVCLELQTRTRKSGIVSHLLEFYPCVLKKSLFHNQKLAVCLVLFFLFSKLVNSLFLWSLVIFVFLEFI